jgi:hypothetical protein
MPRAPPWCTQSGLSELQLWLSTDLVCASEHDTLAYTGASCATASKITAQLSYTRRVDGLSADGGRLEIFGAPDGVVRLELGP